MSATQFPLEIMREYLIIKLPKKLFLDWVKGWVGRGENKVLGWVRESCVIEPVCVCSYICVCVHVYDRGMGWGVWVL